MGAELGQTSDPRALIPGSPEAIEDHAGTLTDHGTRAETVGGSLSRVDVGTWSGAAANGFLDRFSYEPPRWTRAGDALTSSAGTLTGYADTLRWAQSEAAEAVRLWERGEAEAGAAKETLQRQANELLGRARQQLEEAGSRAAQALDGLVSGTKGEAEAKGPNGDWSWKGPEFSGSLGGRAFGTEKTNGNAVENKPGFELTLGGIEGHYNVAEASASGQTNVAGVELTGKAEASLGVQGSATAGIDQDGLKVGAEGSIGARASAEGSANYGIVGANAKGEAFVGAEAGAGVTAGKDGLEAKAEAFAGARASGSVGGDVGGIGAGLKGEAWAGAGAEAKATFGKGEDGKWHIGGEVGVGLGVGGKIGGEITVDPGKVVDTAGKAVDAIGDAASKLNPFD
jgi:Putative T7SS secretion signal domain